MCGCDGVTYGNSCLATLAMTSVAYVGACQEEQLYCGGIAGIMCPRDLVCVDNPADDCDPERGGSDCIGICVAP